MRNNIFYSIVFISLSFVSFSQHIDLGRKWVDTLSSSHFFGRGYVNDGVNKAAEFIEKEFKDIGLDHLPDQNSFFQEFGFEVNTFPGIVAVKYGKRKLINGVHFMVDPNSGSGELKNIKLTKVDTADLKDDSRMKILMNEVQSGKTDGILFDLRGVNKTDEMNIKHQILGFGNYFPLVFITSNKMDWGVGRTQLKHPVISIADSIYKPKKKFSICIEAELISDFRNKNVMGYIPSKEENAKTFIFTAHYDHLGGMGSEVYIPGAHDNASGTSMLGALASYYVSHPPKHNIVFIAFAGEEAGLLGSEYFVRSDVMKLDSINFVLNLDIMGSGDEGITVVNGGIFEDAFLLLKSINEEKNYLKRIKSRGETQNSDHYYFYKNGVPAFFIYSQGEYKHYHDIYDVYENLPFSAYDEIVSLLIDFVERY
jgi:hypothetical protein